MKRLMIAGLASLLLHAGGLLAVWTVMNVPPESLRALLVELRPPLAEGLPPRRVPVRTSQARPAVLQPVLRSNPIPALPPLDETPTPSRSEEETGPISPKEEPGDPTPQTGTLTVRAPVSAENGGTSSEPIRPFSGSSGTGQGGWPGRVSAVPSSESGVPSAFTAEGAAVDWGFLTLLRSKIEGTVIYPSTARRRGLAGLVELEIRLRSDGSVEKITVVRSSGHTLLDQAAVRGVEEAAPFPLSPELPHRSVIVLLPITFHLR